MKIYTIRDIARKAQVGVSTVSRVLNGRPDVSEETRKKVLDVIEACDYVQNGNARLLKQSSAEFAAIIVRGRQNTFLSDIAEQMLSYAQEMDIACLVEYIDEEADEFDAIRRLYTEKRASGFILLGSRIDARSKIIDSLGVPCVFATVDASGCTLKNASSVCIDDKNAACTVMDQLIERGHRRIAVFGGLQDGDDVFARRYRGVLQSLKNHGLSFDPELYVITRFSLQGAYESAKRFFRSERDITAVMAMSDTVAFGVIRALQDIGMRVPEDISVTGFDGVEMARYFIPSIATWRQPTSEIARRSVQILNGVMKHGDDHRHELVASDLVEGESICSVV